MTNKKRESYNDSFRQLLQAEPTINPTDFMVDFEAAAISAVQENFPQAEVHGCHFHFGQNIWRHIQAEGLQLKYNEDEDFAFQLRLLIALAFVPVENVIDAYTELVSTDFFTQPNEHKDAIERLLTYFQFTYVYGLDRLGNRKEPTFPIKLWNMYDVTLSGKNLKYKLLNNWLKPYW